MVPYVDDVVDVSVMRAVLFVLYVVQVWCLAQLPCYG